MNAPDCMPPSQWDKKVKRSDARTTWRAARMMEQAHQKHLAERQKALRK